MYGYRFIVDHVHDGDTIMGTLDLGLGIRLGPNPLFAIRLAGINSPELKTPEGDSAAAYLGTIVAVGTELAVQSMRWDKYGRRIDAVAWLAGAEESAPSLNQRMLDEGHAVPYKP
jgi:endonuclease YncB( thermonuclease family)